MQPLNQYHQIVYTAAEAAQVPIKLVEVSENTVLVDVELPSMWRLIHVKKTEATHELFYNAFLKIKQ